MNCITSRQQLAAKVHEYYLGWKQPSGFYLNFEPEMIEFCRQQYYKLLKLAIQAYKEVASMKFYSFVVPGWCNTQVIRAASFKDAKEQANTMSAGQYTFLIEISASEAEQIKKTWEQI